MKHRLIMTASAMTFLMCVAFGCANQDVFRPVALEGPASGYVAIADTAAQKVINGWNAEPGTDYVGQGALGLHDYQRQAEIGCWEEYRRWGPFTVQGEHRPVLAVHYHLTRRLHVLDGPNDFAIWVYLDTGETLVI